MSPHKSVIETESLKIKIAIGKLKSSLNFWIGAFANQFEDRGGTFTDCLGIIEGRKDDIVVKLLSQDPSNYDDAPREGIRRILEQATGKSFPRSDKLSTNDFSSFSFRMGTTVATNALVERKGDPIALLVTKGFRDALHIGNQSRPNLFTLNIQRPDVLYEQVV